MREVDMPGAVSIALEREPDYFQAAAVEGDRLDLVVARCADRLVGALSVARRMMFVNGEPRRVAYLSMARLERPWRGRRLVPAALERVGRTLREEGTDLCLCTVIADNRVRALLEKPRAGMPAFEPRERICTLVIPTWRDRRPPAGVRIRGARREDMPDIVACLRRNGARRQFAVAWSSGDLESPSRTRGLSVEDFVVAEQGGRISGCVALWDQSAFKQSVIRGYTAALGRARGLVNLAAPLVNRPRLPRAGRPFLHAYLSHLAVDEDAPGPTVALLAAAYSRARARSIANLTIGFSERDPRLAAVRRSLGGMEYWSVLYTLTWPGGDADAVPLDGRPAGLEIATL
jgi:ribosomal protein S18 acetylase RimI-like enzyme